MGKTRAVTRRGALKLAAASTALPLVHIRTAGAAGKLSIGLWDHWVPGANDVMQKQVDAWAAKEKVDVAVDFITSSGKKILITAAAEHQAGSGHDFIQMYNWDVGNFANRLEPVDDVVKDLSDKYGSYGPISEYLAKSQGHWWAVPSSTGTLTLPCAGRISMLKDIAGIDIKAMFPASPSDPKASENWTYDTFLKAAEACAKAGVPFGLGLGSTDDSVNNTGIIYSAFGAQLVNAKGEITLDTPEMMAMMEYCQKLVKFLPSDTVSYDDASNNRALISGKSALILNPPSAWAVAKRDAPKVAEDTWHFPSPTGPKGRYNPYNYSYYGTWSFGKNKSAAKELIRYLQQREQVEGRCNASSGYDIPPFTSMADFKIWEEVEPPKGTVYNYPIRPWHNAKQNITAYPAPRDVAVQMYSRAIHPTLIAKLHSGQSIKQALAWAKDELEGFIR
ncbi:MAG: extracellular solute-binding protein [Proteobacteria bacterium]|nr:extracellular solute-binding protein [Pseudomonadota bacterium]